MSMRLESLTFDARDPATLAAWWSEAIGWPICYQDDDEINLCERIEEDGTHPYPEISFVSVEHPHEGQERIHLDLNSFSVADQEATGFERGVPTLRLIRSVRAHHRGHDR